MGIEQLVILVLIGLISLINWIVQKSADVRARRKAEREESPDESFHPREEAEPLMTRGTREHEPKPSAGNESMRQLMEALGVELPEAEDPRVSQPPSPLPSMEESFASVTPPRLPSLIEMANRTENRSRRDDGPGELTREKRRALAKKRAMPPTRKTVAPSKQIGRLLTSPGGLRNGIVLSEILGPPKAFRQD